jgi:protein phosphatase PTC7
VILRGSIIHEANDNDARDVAFNTSTALCSHDFQKDIVNEIKTSQISLEEGDIIVLGSDRVFDNLFKDEIVSLVKQLTSPLSSQEILDAAEKIGSQVHQVAQSKEKRTPWSVYAEAHKRM